MGKMNKKKTKNKTKKIINSHLGSRRVDNSCRNIQLLLRHKLLLIQRGVNQQHDHRAIACKKRGCGIGLVNGRHVDKDDGGFTLVQAGEEDKFACV